MKRTPGWIAALPSLVVPVCIGSSLYLGLQYLIDQNYIADETVLRYLTGHPVSSITVAMFLIGMSSVMLIGWNLFQQFAAEDSINLELKQKREDAESGDVCDLAIDHADLLMAMPSRYQGHYLWERLLNAVHSIYRTGTTAGVEEELKYLSDLDQERQQQRYSLVRILIWATPMLGFLGTVLGISQALGGIAIGPDNDFQQMMNGLRGNLYIAFDTTALALTLSMAMMFSTFFAERFESQLLRLVDQRARSEVARQYELALSVHESDSKQVVEAIREVVEGQTDIWRSSIRKAEQAWTASLTQTNEMVRSNLSESLDENVAALAHYLGEAIEKADASMSQRWSQWQVGLSENARLMEKHMVLLSEQTASVRNIVRSLEDSTAFDSALKHQQDAIEATAKTHDVLSQLLTKVEKAALAPARTPKSIPVPEKVAKEVHFTPLPEPGPISINRLKLKSVLAEPDRAVEPMSIRMFKEDSSESEDAAEATNQPTKDLVSDSVPESQNENASEAESEISGEVQAETSDNLNPDAVIEIDLNSQVESASDSEVDSVALFKPLRPDSNFAKVLKAVDGRNDNGKKDVLFAGGGETEVDGSSRASENNTSDTPARTSEVAFRSRPGNRRAA